MRKIKILLNVLLIAIFSIMFASCDDHEARKKANAPVLVDTIEEMVTNVNFEGALYSTLYKNSQETKVCAIDSTLETITKQKQDLLHEIVLLKKKEIDSDDACQILKNTIALLDTELLYLREDAFRMRQKLDNLTVMTNEVDEHDNEKIASILLDMKILDDFAQVNLEYTEKISNLKKKLKLIQANYNV